MRSAVLVGISVLLAAALGFYYLLDRIRSQECSNERDRCIQQCDRNRDRRLGENQIRRNQIQLELNQQLLECLVNNLGNTAATQQCQTERTANAQTLFAQLDVSDNRIRSAHEACLTTCQDQAAACDATPTLRSPDAAPAVEVECIDRPSSPCFKEVLEICTVIAGPCDDCWERLCGDGMWSFESERPLEVTLVAATDPVKSPRVLSTSALKGKEATLPIPGEIKLNPGERLYLGFNPKDQPGGRVRAVIRRSKSPSR